MRSASNDASPATAVTLAKSALVGVVATLVDLVALFVVVELLGLPPVVANIPALALGLAVQFFGNKHYAFEDDSRDLLRQGGQFALVEIGAFALNAIAYHLLVTLTPVGYLAARLIGSALVYFAYSFPLWGRIFRPAQAE